MKKSLNLLLASLLLLLCACTQNTTKETSAKPSVWIPGWKTGAHLTMERVAPAIVEVNGYIYIIGGVNHDSFLNSTEYAKIQEDGSLGPWQAGTNLNIERAWMEATTHNGYIYVVGGANSTDKNKLYASELLASVERARINPDGSLGKWEKEENSMAVPRRCNKVVFWNNRIYAIGGYAGVMLDLVESAPIREDGSLGKWVLDPKKMVEVRYVCGVKVKKGALYVIGGHAPVTGTGMATVEWAKINNDGTTTDWKHLASLQTKRYGLGSAYHHGTFYAMGGITGMTNLSSIEKAQLKDDGEITPWEYTTPLAMNRMNFGAAVYKDWIYVIGGKNNQGYLDSVQYATFNDKGDIGYMGTQKEYEAFKAEEAKKEELERLDKAVKQTVSFEGRVIRVMQSEGYTFIRVTIDDQVSPDGKKTIKGDTIWLAAPATKVAVHDKVRFGTGLFMPKFFSRELQYKFNDGIFFMEKVDVVR